MKIILLFLSVSVLVFSQTRLEKFYNSDKLEISKTEFFKLKNNGENLDLYYENDTIILGFLIKHSYKGRLDSLMFENLKNYISQISNVRLNSQSSIIINYLSPVPKIDSNNIHISNWNLFDKDYMRKIKKLANNKQFWIASPEVDSVQLKRYSKNNTLWLKDDEDYFKKNFFEFDINYGNFIIIDKYGNYTIRLGEYGKNEIFKTLEDMNLIK